MKENKLEQSNGLSEKYSSENIKFFDNLVKKYDLEQNPDQLIIEKKDGSRVFLPKWRKIPIDGKGEKTESIEERIIKYLE